METPLGGRPIGSSEFTYIVCVGGFHALAERSQTQIARRREGESGYNLQFSKRNNSVAMAEATRGSPLW